MERIELQVNNDMAGKRLDVVLSACLEDISRSYVQKLIESGNVTVNGDFCNEKKQKAKAGDAIVVEIPDPETLEVLPENIQLDIV